MWNVYIPLFVIFFLLLIFLGQGTSSANYRPEFLDHFDQKDKETDDDSNAQIPSTNKPPENTVPEADSPAGQALQKQLQQIRHQALHCVTDFCSIRGISLS